MNYVFDLDGTVTSEELLPRIAAGVGLSNEIATLTRLTIAGRLPFAYSFEMRVEMLRSIPISRVRSIVDTVEIDPHIEAFIRENGRRTHILTGNLDAWVAPLCRRLGAGLLCSKAEVDGDKLVGIREIIDKGEAAKQIPRPFVAIGDGHNDRGLFQAADIAVAYGGVHEPASSLLDVATHAIYDGEALCRFLRRLS